MAIQLSLITAHFFDKQKLQQKQLLKFIYININALYSYSLIVLIFSVQIECIKLLLIYTKCNKNIN